MDAGDEYLSHEQQHPELYDRGPFHIGPDVEGWPIDYPCEECGAEPGEECRPCCTGQDADADEDQDEEQRPGRAPGPVGGYKAPSPR